MVLADDDPGGHAPGAPLLVAGRAEEGHHGRAHGGGDVHGGRVHADEEAGPAGQGRQFLQAQLAGEVHRGTGQAGLDGGHHLPLGRVRRGGDHHRPALGLEAVDDGGHGLRGPALETPAGGGMQMHEGLAAQALVRQQLAHPALRFHAGHQGQAPLIRRRIEADAAQGVQVALHRVAQGIARSADEMGEAVLPETAPTPHLGPHGPAGADGPGQPGAPGMVGEVNHQVVTGMAQGLQQLPFGPQVAPGAKLLPLPVDAVHGVDGRMLAQHLRRVPVHQGVEAGLGRRRLEGGEHRRRQQHVAVVAQLDHQGAAHLVEGDGIGKIGFGHGSGFYRLRSPFSG